MSNNYLYNVEFTVDDFDLWTFPDDLQNPENLPSTVRFTMRPAVCLKIGEEEFIDQVNCDKKFVKNAMFGMSDSELEAEAEGKIEVYKTKADGEEVTIGAYIFSELQKNFKKLADEFNEHSTKKIVKFGGNQPSFEIIKELVQLVSFC